MFKYKKTKFRLENITNIIKKKLKCYYPLKSNIKYLKNNNYIFKTVTCVLFSKKKYPNTTILTTTCDF